MLFHFPPLPLSFDYTSLRDYWFPTLLHCFLLHIPYYIVYSHLLGIYSASFTYLPTYLSSFLPLYLTFPLGNRPFRAGHSGRWFMLPRPLVFCTSILSVLFLFFISLLFLLKTKEALSAKICYPSTIVLII